MKESQESAKQAFWQMPNTGGALRSLSTAHASNETKALARIPPIARVRVFRIRRLATRCFPFLVSSSSLSCSCGCGLRKGRRRTLRGTVAWCFWPLITPVLRVVGRRRHPPPGAEWKINSFVVFWRARKTLPCLTPLEAVMVGGGRFPQVVGCHRRVQRVLDATLQLLAFPFHNTRQLLLLPNL